jgi:hypothetical protein
VEIGIGIGSYPKKAILGVIGAESCPLIMKVTFEVIQLFFPKISI